MDEKSINTDKVLQILGYVSMGLGVVGSILGGIVSERKFNRKFDVEFNKRMDERMSKVYNIDDFKKE